MVIRELQGADIDDAHRIETEVSPDPWSRALLAEELTTGGTPRHWLVATVDDRLIGFGGVLFVADDAHIMNLAVDRAEQRQGVAARLLARLLTDAGDRGAVGATLEVRASNAAALGLYGRFGFIEAGRRARYYPDGEDAVIMWAHRIYNGDYRDRLAVLGAPR